MILKDKDKRWGKALLLDIFNNEILAQSVSPVARENNPITIV